MPFSTSREPNKADDNEMVLLEVADFMIAREVAAPAPTPAPAPVPAAGGTK